MSIEEINYEPLLKAYTKFKQFLPNQNTDQEKAGLIQAYEYSFELAWKMMRRVLKYKGMVTNSPRETIRQAAIEGLIDDAEIWFNFLLKRNLATHTYNEIVVDDILEVCENFELELSKLINKLINEEKF